MKKVKINFKGRLREVGYVISNSGITILYIEGVDSPMEDFLIPLHRNYLIIEILQRSIPYPNTK